jgi:hypothetical protein
MKIPFAFIFRTALIVALLSVVYNETGWATTLLLFLAYFRFEVENILFANALKQASAQAKEVPDA